MAINALLIALSIHLATGWISPLPKGGLRSRPRYGPRPLSAARTANDDNAKRRYPGGEILGHSGKIGSYLLHRLNGPILPLPSTELRYPQSLNVAAVPRGVAAGCLSPSGAPIFACVPSSSIRDVWDATLPGRREDLVFLCNCIPSEHLRFDDDVGVTMSVLHFGVSRSHHGDGDGPSIPIPKLNSSPNSPPTVVYGKHADALASLLKEDDIPVNIASHPGEVQVAAARKLAWSSLMWLMCHGASDGGEPITVKDVHELKSKELEKLVEEVLPSLATLASNSWTGSGRDADMDQSKSIGSVQDVLDYLEQYSMSISDGNVVPNKDLALREIRERNGLLLRTGGGEQNYHKELLRRVAGEEILAQCLEADGNEKDSAPRESLQRIKCTSSNLEFLFCSGQSSFSERPGEGKKAIVVGAGMVGSNIAYHLSRRGVKVTVMDRRTNILPPDDRQGREIDPGTATCSSFAWLNSNDKAPLSYKQFNQLGMEVWRRHGVLKHLPVWCGSLVRTAKKEGAEADGDVPTLKHGPYYTHVGPLSSTDAQRLEPGIDWAASGAKGAVDESPRDTEVHFYPEEGHADPYEAMKVLRISARDNGVDFVEGAEISNLVRDENDRVVGVEFGKSQDASESAFAAADVVIIAAGANSSDPSLGIGSKRLTLLEQPGTLAFARSSNGNDSGGSLDQKRLKGIFVDTIAEAHVLRRPDGAIVVGGGQLVVGGGDDEALNDASTSASEKREDELVGNAMIRAAAGGIAPYDLQQYELVKVTRANRPMPSDGFPVAGFVDQGLYLAVMHSAITMGPLVGELAAYEVYEDVTRQNSGNGDDSHSGFQILDRYRPSQSRAEN